ncbi:aldehyde dehydrogenase [Vineibacter terrae]|uniref:Aldehyde dehydrogenase n=1 Tax=Vineibacter terrae TaxID=2586908 RepID=A0A5C8PGN6_9HYPH|nr:aldehyde dehydrogenase [Vineibacter terrae]TXL72947.1 aldehyde dehydrogenase [Vineibacter terrae]
MVAKYQLFIDGKWRDSADGGTFEAINPFNQEVWAHIPAATEADVAAATAAARQAFEATWRRTSGLERATLLNRLAALLEENADRISLLETTDNGKVIRETRSQMFFAARVYRFFAGYADKIWGNVIPLDQPDIMDFAVREPYGVVGIITAWNSPIALLANKLPAALAAGNCVVIKPSEHASATTLEFGKLVEQAGFPPGVVNIVTGDARIGRALVAGGGLDKVSFTGSPNAGREIAATAGRNLTPVTLELGGKSPNIVFADADMDKAVVGALAGIFAATGQTCIAGSRLLVQRPVYDRMVTRLAERAQKIVMGDPRNPATEMGTAANEPQFRRILDYIDIARKEGARLVTGGGPARDGDLAKGLFIQPTIFADVDNTMRVAQEEIFGPVLSVIPFDEEAQAVAIGNASPYGLACGVWTRDVSRALRMIRAMRTGVVWVNTYRMVAAQAPFGGVKHSGFGRERGEQGLLEFTTSKNVMIDFSDETRDPFAVKA